jgi:hypothetical protein
MIDFIGLDLIEFHDVPLKSISIRNEISSDLVLEIMLWDEDIDDYVCNTLIFGGLSRIKPKIILTKGIYNLEIYSFDYYLENELFCGKLICLAGHGKPSLNIEFTCRTVEIKRNNN